MSELTNPFTGLGHRPPRVPLGSEGLIKPTEGDSKAALMREALHDNGPLTAAQLTELADLKNSAYVSALLKADLRNGRVHFKRGKYALNDEYDEAQAELIRKAADMLRRNGYEIVRAGA